MEEDDEGGAGGVVEDEAEVEVEEALPSFMVLRYRSSRTSVFFYFQLQPWNTINLTSFRFSLNIQF